MNWVTASAGAVTIPLTSIPGSPPLELDDEELELELEEALLLDELELAELDDELEEEPAT
ncbi:MAG: hypothetical protein NVV73_12140 [Cellvibrionaceae bacterium]|nr:hypothetical protein [Cellvibrionaceae bacterium]